MPLSPGTRLGPYAVTAKIGEGGMGEVYQARDTKLDRDVALKVLPAAFTSDPDRLARFEREAKVLASLNHPNIAAIHGLEEAEGVRALVLELVEGPTLAERIAQGPIPLDEALPIATQIADALEAAHEQGVIHRDLKPANIKVRDDGTVKVLDFGLAKALEAEPSGDPSQSPTLTAAATQMGVILGTAAYMSPEQAKGKVVDKRADVWAFGAVLYEMLTGTRAFVGADVSDTLAAVLRADVDLEALPQATPARLRQVVSVCLQKEARQRLGDIAAVRLAMGGAFETTVTAPTEPAGTPTLQLWQRPVVALGIVVFAVVIAGLAGWSLTRPTLTPRSLARFAVITPTDGPLLTGSLSPEVAISPDGTHIVYASGGVAMTRRLYLREIDQLEATPLRGTEGGNAPFFSPDGESVGFRSIPDSILKRVSVLGGPAVTIIEIGASPRGKSWGPDDSIVYATTASQGLMRVPAVGGEPEVLTTVDPEQQGETDHFWPEVLPNGKGVLFTAWSGSDEASRLAVFSLETGEVTYLFPGGSNPHYSPTGHIVYGVGGTLRAIGFDAERLELTSNNPVPVLENANTRASGAGDFSFSANGSLVYVPGVAATDGPARTLVWVDRQGREEPVGAPPRPYERPRVSPDGARLAVQIADPANTDVGIYYLARGTSTRLTTDAARDTHPLWTPDGTQVVFFSNREGAGGVFRRRADGTGLVERLMPGPNNPRAYAWASDGQQLVLIQGGAETFDLAVLSLEGEPTLEPLIQTPLFAESRPAVSPDGQWIAYYSNESGEREVYVQPFPALDSKSQISTTGGTSPVWGPEGRELFYRNGEAMLVVPIATEGGLAPGIPEVLFEGRYFGSVQPTELGRHYDLAPDGERFLMIKPATDDASTPTQIIFVENWFDELQRLVPTP